MTEDERLYLAFGPGGSATSPRSTTALLEGRNPDGDPTTQTFDPAPPRREVHDEVRTTRHRRSVTALVAGGAALALVIGGVTVYAAHREPSTTASTTTTAPFGPSTQTVPGGGTDPGSGSTDPGSGSTDPGSGSTDPGTGGMGAPGFGGPSGGDRSGGASTQSATEASTSQQAGVVIIETVLGYRGAEAAGTGIVLSEQGLILTNNHVVEGSTTINVTVASTGTTYPATLVGTDASQDIAVLQLRDASGLTVAALDDDGEPAIGDEVTAIGNAGGGGTLMAASGTVSSLDATVTTTSDVSGRTVSLDRMIEFGAAVVSGDSGGAVIDGEGEVVGVTTAASAGTATTSGYAIDIDKALQIASVIEAGKASSTVTIGYPAFLGVQFAATSTGVATVAGVIGSTPAEGAGLAAGDTITQVDGEQVTSSDEVAATIAGHKPGDKVTIDWTDTSGQTHRATVTLIAGPAD